MARLWSHPIFLYTTSWNCARGDRTGCVLFGFRQIPTSDTASVVEQMSRLRLVGDLLILVSARMALSNAVSNKKRYARLRAAFQSSTSFDRQRLELLRINMIRAIV